MPAILGTERNIFIIPTKIYEKIYASGGNFEAIRTGTMLSSILVLSAAAILYIQSLVLSSGRFQVISGKSMRPMVLKLRGLKWPLLILSVVYIALTVVLPTVTIFLVGTLKTYGLAFKLENGMKKLIESLQYKREQHDWEDSFILKESNLAYGVATPDQAS